MTVIIRGAGTEFRLTGIAIRIAIEKGELSRREQLPFFQRGDEVSAVISIGNTIAPAIAIPIAIKIRNHHPFNYFIIVQ